MLGHPDLSAGVLEVAELRDGRFIWHPVPDPLFVGELPTREQVAVSTAFNGGEGAWWHDGTVFFSTKGDNKVWAYEIASGRVRVIYDASTHATPPLRGVDNLTVSCCGDVLVAEDGGTMQVVAVLPDGRVKPLVQVVGHDGSEICGPAFDPSGTRLYFSSQRGPGGGWTFEVQGPFHEPMR
jgi:outer membrane protein assembly factor BamB